MSTPSNPSSIMIYKIIREFKNSGRKVYPTSELNHFSKQVIDFANSICDDDFWIVQTPEVNEDLLRICDISRSTCVLNEQKYSNGGDKFTKTKIGQMPYTWLKGAIKILNEDENRKSSLQNSSTSRYIDKLSLGIADDESTK